MLLLVLLITIPLVVVYVVHRLMLELLLVKTVPLISLAGPISMDLVDVMVVVVLDLIVPILHSWEVILKYVFHQPSISLKTPNNCTNRIWHIETNSGVN